MHATEFVDSYFYAWNRRDPEGVADHLASNGLYYDIPENARRTHDELIVSLYEFFSAYRHRYELVGSILAERDTIAFQYRMVPFDDADGADTQKTYHGAEFVTLRDDAAIMITDYYDGPSATQLPILPQRRRTEPRRRKYAKSGLNDQQLAEYMAKLEEVMRSQQIFLRSDLTLPKLADAIDCSVNHLSQVINSGFGVSFFDYLNQYRIRYARELLTRDDNQEQAILNIAYSVGFNSNSAFYAAFKKYAGQTPAHYRREQLNPSK
jgi:AraC-like DNA-binding protein